MHKLEHKRGAFGFYAREILARLDHNFGDPNLLALFKRIAQKHVGLVPALLRLEIIRFVKIDRVDFIEIDKILNVDRLRRFQIDALKVFVFEHDEFPFLVLVTFDDLIPGTSLPSFLGHAFVIDRAQVGLAQKPKLKLLPAGRRIQGDGDIDQTEADCAFPNWCVDLKIIRAAERDERKVCLGAYYEYLEDLNFYRRLPNPPMRMKLVVSVFCYRGRVGGAISRHLGRHSKASKVYLLRNQLGKGGYAPLENRAMIAPWRRWEQSLEFTK